MNIFLEEWRQEIAEELTTARAELSVHQTEHDSAVDAVSTVERDCREARAALAAIEQPSPYLASTGRFGGRLHDALNGARGKQRLAAGRLQNTRDRILELERVLAQLDEVIHPAAEDAA